MNIALRIILWAEVLVGIHWTLLAATSWTTGGIAVLAALFYTYLLFAAFFLFAAWVYWKRPERRRIAGWIMALPFVFWFLPLLMRLPAGGDLSTKQLSAVLLVIATIALGLCWISPRKVAAIIPGFLLRSRLVNWLIVLALIAGWMLFVFALVYVANAKSPSTSGTGEGLALLIVMAAMYLIWLGLGSFLAATWAWLSLRGGVEPASRKLNYAQMICAAPAVLCGIVLAFWVQGQAVL